MPLQYFNFGQSLHISLAKAVRRLTSLIEGFRTSGPVIMVFHNASAEIEYFAYLGLDTSAWVTGFRPANQGCDDVQLSHGSVYIVDTQKLFSASGLTKAIPQIKLQKALDALGIPCRRLHNAGNDACCECQRLSARLP